MAELSRERGAWTARRAHYVLQAILEVAAQDGIIARNPARGIKNLPPLPRRRKVYLTYEQVERAAALAGRYRAVIHVAAYVGLRWGEIEGLEGADVDLQKHRIHVRRTVTAGKSTNLPKNGEEREVGYPGFLHDDLRQRVLAAGPDGRLFPDLAKPKNQESWFETLRKKAELPEGFVFHDFRHSAASFAVSSGANVKVVQNMLGHRSAAMTLDVYADLFSQDIDDVADRISENRDNALSGVEKLVI